MSMPVYLKRVEKFVFALGPIVISLNAAIGLAWSETLAEYIRKNDYMLDQRFYDAIGDASKEELSDAACDLFIALGRMKTYNDVRVPSILSRLKADQKRCAPVLVSLLMMRTAEDADSAGDGLVLIGHDAIAPLLEKWRTVSGEDRQKLLYVLGRLDAVPKPFFQEASRDILTFDRNKSTEALRKLSLVRRQAALALPALTAFIKRALSPSAPEWVTFNIEELRDGNEVDEPTPPLELAIEILGAIGPAARASSEWIIESLRIYPVSAGHALAALGGGDEYFWKALHHPKISVRKGALQILSSIDPEALGRIATPRLCRYVSELRDDPSEEMRNAQKEFGDGLAEYCGASH